MIARRLWIVMVLNNIVIKSLFEIHVELVVEVGVLIGGRCGERMNGGETGWIVELGSSLAVVCCSIASNRCHCGADGVGDIVCISEISRSFKPQIIFQVKFESFKPQIVP